MAGTPSAPGRADPIRASRNDLARRPASTEKLFGAQLPVGLQQHCGEERGSGFPLPVGVPDTVGSYCGLPALRNGTHVVHFGVLAAGREIGTIALEPPDISRPTCLRERHGHWRTPGDSQ